MDPSYDVQRLRLPDHMVHKLVQKRIKVPRHKTGQRFLKGPIPMAWLAAAMKLPGKALHVGINLWFCAGLKRCGEIAISLSRLKEVGISRAAASRGLMRLERAGLVAVQRGLGRKPVVRLLDTAADSAGAADE